MTSIIMLVHNAVEYTRNTIETLQGTKGEWELIVVDNASDQKTRKMLYKMYEMKKINKLLMLDENTLFAKGNNLGSKLCAQNSEKILLLNSDIDIRNKEWLCEMENQYEKGIFTLGVCENVSVGRFSPFRVGLKTPISVNLKSPMHHVCY